MDLRAVSASLERASHVIARRAAMALGDAMADAIARFAQDVADDARRSALRRLTDAVMTAPVRVAGGATVRARSADETPSRRRRARHRAAEPAPATSDAIAPELPGSAERAHLEGVAEAPTVDPEPTPIAEPITAEPTAPGPSDDLLAA